MIKQPSDQIHFDITLSTATPFLITPFRFIPGMKAILFRQSPLVQLELAGGAPRERKLSNWSKNKSLQTTMLYYIM